MGEGGRWGDCEKWLRIERIGLSKGGGGERRNGLSEGGLGGSRAWNGDFRLSVSSQRSQG